MTQQLASSVATPIIRPNIKEDRHFVTALARGLELLACFRDVLDKIEWDARVAA